LINTNSSHIIIFNKKGQALLLKRAINDEWEPDKWSIPGGKREKGETIHQNIVREVMEETNLVIFPKFVKYLPEISEKLNHIFFMTSKFEGNIKLDKENSDYIWIMPENIIEKLSVPNLKQEVFAAKQIFDQNLKIIIK